MTRKDLPGKDKKIARVRHIDMSRFPDKWDLADLVENGYVGEKLNKLMAEIVRDGPPEVHERFQKQEPEKKPTAAPPKPKPKPDDEEEVELPLKYSEDSLAEIFTNRYAKTMVYCSELGHWYYWNGHVWREEKTGMAIDNARKVCREIASAAADDEDLGNQRLKIARAILKRNVFGSVASIAQCDRRHVVLANQFDADPWVISTPDGIVDLQTGEVRQAKRSEWCRKVTSVGPAKMETPAWNKFLDEATLGDVELQKYLQRIAGYVLTGCISEQKFFFIYGEGGSGKGTFLNALNWIMNDYGTQAQMETFIEKKFQQHMAEIAVLDGARLVVASETNAGQRWNEARIKGMTGGDPITANRMRENPYTFRPVFKLLFTGNTRPHLANVDAAMKRRMYLIPFDHKVPEAKVEGNLDKMIQAEGQGVMQWMVDGCLEWQTIGLKPPERVMAATAEYFETEDRIGRFISEVCVIAPTVRVNTTQLFAAYQTWCGEQAEFCLRRLAFLEHMRNKGYSSQKIGGQQIIEGIGIAAFESPGQATGDHGFKYN